MMMTMRRRRGARSVQTLQLLPRGGVSLPNFTDLKLCPVPPSGPFSGPGMMAGA
jgi:hypothetical protein